jgi:multimeric flavodoxin WrbA
MKVAVINGSPRGKDGNTNVMVTAFLKGAQEAGAKTVSIFLAEKEINHCKSCYSCVTRGRCAINDDMAEVLSVTEGADVLVLATPLYFDNISGMLKAFMDRRFALVDFSHMVKDANGESRYVKPGTDDIPFKSGIKAPKLMLISSCGYSERSQFQVISLWIKRAARNMIAEIIGEIYATQGQFMKTQAELNKPFTAGYPQLIDNVANYLQLLETAGKEVAADIRLSKATNQKLMAQQFMPDELFIQIRNSLFDGAPPK